MARQGSSSKMTLILSPAARSQCGTDALRRPALGQVDLLPDGPFLHVGAAIVGGRGNAHS